MIDLDLLWDAVARGLGFLQPSNSLVMGLGVALVIFLVLVGLLWRARSG